MGRGDHQSKSQTATSLLFGPRGSKSGSRPIGPREAYHKIVRQDPHQLIAQLSEEPLILEAGPVKQSSRTMKSWRIVPTRAADRAAFEVKTDFSLHGRNERSGSAGICWSLEEAVDKMREDYLRTCRMVLIRDNDAEAERINLQRAQSNLVEAAIKAGVKIDDQGELIS